jgi:hypothetical protein
MNIKKRLRKIEMRAESQTANVERHGITLDQWRRLAAGIDVLPEIPERNRPAFVEWQNRAGERRRGAAATAKMFEI